MKNTMKLVLVAVGSLCLPMLGTADTVDISTAHFSQDELTTYNYSSVPDPTTAVKEGSLVFSMMLASADANMGVRWNQENRGHGSDTNLADYVVSFDLAIPTGTTSNVSCGLTIAGTGTDNVGVPVDLSKVSADGSYTHYSISLGGLVFNSVFNGGTAVLNPTDSTFTVEFAAFGTGNGKQVYQIKNFKISRVGGTDPSTSK